ncbi:hypothetical protein Tco_0918756 [Tanacetum coccineum]
MKYEFMALAAAIKEAKWLRNLLLEIPLWYKPITPISFRCDSAATLTKAYSQMYNGKSRHLGDFKENPDDEVDERTSEEYLRDLDIEFHERALLARVLMALLMMNLLLAKIIKEMVEWIDITMRKVVNESLGLTEAPIDPKSSKESESKPQTPLPPLKII